MLRATISNEIERSNLDSAMRPRLYAAISSAPGIGGCKATGEQGNCDYQCYYFSKGLAQQRGYSPGFLLPTILIGNKQKGNISDIYPKKSSGP